MSKEPYSDPRWWLWLPADKEWDGPVDENGIPIKPKKSNFSWEKFFIENPDQAKKLSNYEEFKKEHPEVEWD